MVAWHIHVHVGASGRDPIKAGGGVCLLYPLKWRLGDWYLLQDNMRGVCVCVHVEVRGSG